MSGPIVGSTVFTILQDTIMRQTAYWPALLGGNILALVLAVPERIVETFVKRGDLRLRW